MNDRRSKKLEWIDLGPAYYTPTEYRDCLYQLDRIGRFLGGDHATLRSIDRLKILPSSILDVGCGGGLFTMRVASRYPKAIVVGIDLSQEAIAFAKEHLKQFHPPLTDVQFLVTETPELDNFNQQFDIVMATLVCHHLSDQELISFLKQACRIAKKTVILNDLHRHPLASAGFAMLVPLFFRNRLIWHDGLLSIRRAFTRKDWWSYLEAAGIDKTHCTVKWHWAFRWVITIDTSALRRKEA